MADSDGFFDSLRHYHRRNKDYNPAADPQLSLEEQSLVSTAIFQADQEEAYKIENFWERAKAAWKGVPQGVAVIIMVMVTFGTNKNDDRFSGGGQIHLSELRPLNNRDIKILKKAGFDIHDWKGTGSSKYNLYKDEFGNVYQGNLDGSGYGEPLNINLNGPGSP